MTQIPDEPRVELDREHLQNMYRHRFDDADRVRINNFWDLFFDRFLREYIPAKGTVLDLAAGSCEFINRVSASRRIAVDLNPDLEARAEDGVETYACRSDSLEPIPDASVDLVFTSNFFEHLSTPEELMATLGECHRVLRPGGRIVVLMPNLRAVGAKYYDYLDHKLPVTDRSLVEALGLAGFRPTRVIPRFLPYGANPAGVLATGSPSSGLAQLMAKPEVHRAALATYMRLKPAWWFFGGQMLVVAERD